ncbi:MAG: ABC transporter permease [Gemmataceae bacterium]|nr:ABC transporter permease [Gemmataceae bacterium]
MSQANIPHSHQRVPHFNAAALLRWARRHVILLVLVATCTLATARYEAFLTAENLFNVLRQNSMAGLLALGMLFAILSGGIDLSSGALLAVGGFVAAAVSDHGLAVAVGAALSVTGLLGLANGLIITRGRVQPFIATLAVGMMARGMLLAFTREQSIRVAPEAMDFKWLGRGWLGPVPLPVLIVASAYAGAAAVLGHTRFGRHVYAMGDNDEAARLMGLNVGRVRTIVYVVSGALAGLSGALLAARVGVGQPTAGLGWELGAITAVVLGSTTLAGGQGGAWTTLLGVLLLAIIFNIFNLEGTLNSYWQWVLRGVFLLVVVMLQTNRRTTAPVRAA